MFWADVLYVVLLLLSIVFGPYYQKITHPFLKQWTSTLMGFALVFIVSGRFFLHPLIATLINAAIITQLSPKKSHLVSFGFSFFYLLGVFRLGHLVGIPPAPTHTNLIVMMMTLKLPGLAFELNNALFAPEDDIQGANSEALKKVTFLDVFHYSYSYMAVLTGPYYSYRTYWDSLNRPFAKYADAWPLTVHKLKQAAGFLVLFFLLNHFFSAKYTLTPEYAEWPYFYKWFYMYPTFAIFRMRMFIGTILSECVCQMAGLGAYPVSANSAPGKGPKDYKKVIALSNEPDNLKGEKFDFETIHNMSIWEVETCTTVRTAMKVWNTCVQYWMAVNVYKRLPLKSIRTFVTLFLSALWHGYAAGYYVCICQVPLYLPFEDLCVKYYQQQEENSLGRKAWAVFLWFMRLSCMAYLGIPFMLLSFQEIIDFYKHLYVGGHIVLFILYIVMWSLKPVLLGKRKPLESKEKSN